MESERKGEGGMESERREKEGGMELEREGQGGRRREGWSRRVGRKGREKEGGIESEREGEDPCLSPKTFFLEILNQVSTPPSAQLRGGWGKQADARLVEGLGFRRLRVSSLHTPVPPGT